MNIYLVDSGASLFSACYARDKEIFQNANILHSFYYMNDFTEKIIIPNVKRFMLDSGAFTLFSKSGAGINWEDYIKKYASFINRNNIKQFFELDIDNLIGYEKVVYYRKRLEDLTGKQPIPVWHKSRGLDEYIKTCEEYPYVAIGGIVTKEITKSEYKFFPWLINTAHSHETKVHGLGFTSFQELKKYRFDSVDSSSWTSGARFGSVCRFDGKKVVNTGKPQGTRIADYKPLTYHNFKEWLKYVEYAEKRL